MKLKIRWGAVEPPDRFPPQKCGGLIEAGRLSPDQANRL